MAEATRPLSMFGTDHADLKGAKIAAQAGRSTPTPCPRS